MQNDPSAKNSNDQHNKELDGGLTPQADTTQLPINKVVPSTQIVEPRRRGYGINKILWIIVLLCLAPVLLMFGFSAFLAILAKSGASGTELFALALIPISLTLPFLLPVGILSSLILLVRDRRLFHRVLLGPIIIVFVYLLVQSVPLLLRNNTFNQTLSTDQTVALIGECKIESIVKTEDGKTNLRYTDDGYGTPTERPHYADSKGYSQYVAASNKTASSCSNVTTYDNYATGESKDPAWTGDRWVSENEALKLIQDCKIQSVLVYIAAYVPKDGEKISGTKTNYALKEIQTTGVAGDLYIYSRKESDVDLIAPVDDATAKCGFEITTQLMDKALLNKPQR